MKAKCKCGFILDVPPGQEGTVVRCPKCRLKLRLPGGQKGAQPPSAPKPPQAGKPRRDGGIELTWGDEFAAPPPKGPPPPEAKEPEQPASFDWEKGFELEAPPQEGKPEEPEPDAKAEGVGLGFESEEFKLSIDGGEAEAGEEIIDLEPGHVLSSRRVAAVPPAAPGQPQAAVEGKPAVCPKCGRVAAEGAIACPECGTLLSGGTAGAVGRPESRQRRLSKAREAQKVPTNIFSLMLMCIRRPSLLGDIGAGGIAGGSLRLQIAAAFLAMTVVVSVVEGLGPIRGEEFSLAFAALRIGVRITSLFTTVLAMWIVASVVSKGVSFMAILTGLSFVQVLGTIVTVAGLLIGVALGAMVPSVVIAPVVAGVMLTTLIIVFVYQLYFIMGVYDMGCIGAFVLNIVASLLASAILVYVSALLVRTFGLGHALLQ